MEHTCHALECNVPVSPRMFMCLKHWRMIPRADQSALWAVYTPRQEINKNPTPEYITTARRLQVLVADKEGVQVPPLIRARAEGPPS